MEYKKAQFVALNTFLSYWPENLSYAQVIERLESEAGEIDSASEIDSLGDFEDLWPEHLAQLITSLHDQLLETYGE